MTSRGKLICKLAIKNRVSKPVKQTPHASPSQDISAVSSKKKYYSHYA